MKVLTLEDINDYYYFVFDAESINSNSAWPGWMHGLWGFRSSGPFIYSDGDLMFRSSGDREVKIHAGDVLFLNQPVKLGLNSWDGNFVLHSRYGTFT